MRTRKEVRMAWWVVGVAAVAVCAVVIGWLLFFARKQRREIDE